MSDSTVHEQAGAQAFAEGQPIDAVPNLPPAGVLQWQQGWAYAQGQADCRQWITEQGDENARFVVGLQKSDPYYPVRKYRLGSPYFCGFRKAWNEHFASSPERKISEGIICLRDVKAHEEELALSHV